MVHVVDEKVGRPVLYVFAISHYCEKARWALDSVGVEYELRHLPPGAHVQVARDLGAAGSSLPFLFAEGRVIHGSGAILDWADSSAAGPSKHLSPDSEFEEECRALETRLDDVIGVQVRRYYYSEALVEHPDSVLPIFTRDLAASERQSLEENWGLVCQMMTGMMDLGPKQRQESRRFSRADMTAASLLAPLAQPKEHSTYGMLDLPPLARADLALWSSRPTLAWVREIYSAHRCKLAS